jgi:hypothetical protein
LSAGASAGAAAAAAAAKLAADREEEELSSYSDRDLADDWEFKILRSQTGAFKKPEKLREALDQEAKAGWVLVEKFDNSRLRLKRPASARALDGKLDPESDPYRTNFGMSEGKQVALVLGIVLGAIALVAILIPLIVRLKR